MTELQKDFKIYGVDEEFGLIIGYAMVCKEQDRAYVDLQNEHIPEASMFKASVRFMKGARRAKLMHDTEDGTVVFAFPMTTEIAKALEIKPMRTGLIVAIAPDDPATLAKAKSGELTGFSIGGRYVRTTEVEMEVA